LPPGQIWGMSPGSGDESPGLYRVDVTDNPGSGVKIINRPAPAPLQESVRIAEQNLLAQAKLLVGDKSPREHEFSIQARALDSAKSGAKLSVPVLLSLCSSMLQKSMKGGLIAVGSMTLGGGIETIVNAVALAELAMEKGADTLLLPVAARKQLFDISDDVATKVSFLFYSDAADALIKALAD
jgi:ATP-dependent Lon protease